MRKIHRKTKVMAFGTFDIFHKGHESYLKQAKKFGDYLIVVVARDRTVREIKGGPPLNDEKTRLRNVLNSGLADKVVLGNLKNKYAIIRKYRPDEICLGYDQKAFVEDVPQKLVASGLKNVTMRRLKGYKKNIYKSSKLKKGLI
jgi:FAD synthetase